MGKKETADLHDSSFNIFARGSQVGFRLEVTFDVKDIPGLLKGIRASAEHAKKAAQVRRRLEARAASKKGG